MKRTRQLRTFTSVIKGSFNEFFQRSTSTGISILVVTAIALLWSNSPWQLSYSTLLHQPIEIVFATLRLAFTFEHFVNDGLMALFFLLVGLEIKREMLVGELSSRQKALLPMIAAVMGMVGPATIYLLFNADSNSARGWGVPVATDIAFALGILALLGDRVPLGLKVFLAALAIVDDLLAVLVIAIFYTASLNIEMLLTAGIITSILFLGNKLRINTIWFYGLLGLALWVTVLFSGIHATIAGVVFVLCIPADARIDRVSFFTSARELLDKISRQKKSAEDGGAQYDAIHALEKLSEQVQSPLHRIEHGLGRAVSFGIMPLFALVNAGVIIDPSLITSLMSPVSIGIILGLFIGKQLGITFAVWVSVRLKIAVLPSGVSMVQMYGVSLLCGIGFTMALFVAHLAFLDPRHLNIAKLSIIVGSTISAIVGSLVLRSTLPKPLRT